jgi:hypothetical protein
MSVTDVLTAPGERRTVNDEPRTLNAKRFSLTLRLNFHMRDGVPFLVTFKPVPGTDVVRAARLVSFAASAIFPPRTVCLLQYPPLPN